MERHCEPASCSNHTSNTFVFFSQAHVMDKNALCGEFRAPKFIICDFCNYRGHRSAECPSERRESVSDYRVAYCVV